MVGSGNFCAVAGCSNSWRKSKKQDLKLSFYRFPKDPTIRKVWLLKCRRKDSFNHDNSYVCAAHFTEEDFERNLQAELMGTSSKSFLKLKRNSVPSRNLPIDHATTTTIAAEKRRQKAEEKAIQQKHTDAVTSALQSAECYPSTSQPTDVAYDLVDPTTEGTQHDYQKMIQDMEKKYVDLKARYVAAMKTARIDYRKEATRQRQRAVILKKKLKISQEKVNVFNKALKKLQRERNEDKRALESLETVFSANQMKILTSRAKQAKWTHDEIGKAFALRYLSKKAYMYVRNDLKYPLPGISSLKNWAANIKVSSGILKDVLHFMKIFGQDLDSFNRITVLSFDEMKIETTLEYNQKNDEVIGPHSYMQVVMARGLTSKWKQPIFVAFDQPMTAEILRNIIRLLEDIGFPTVACVSDMGGGNVGLMKKLGVTVQKPYFSVSNISRSIYYFCDAPHLLKLLRNWFIDTGFLLSNGDFVGVAPVKELIDKSGHEVSSIHKLTESHVVCEGSARQNVRKAAQLLSHTTATALLHYLPGSDANLARNSGQFVEMVSQWFDLMNVRSPASNIPFRSPYGRSIDEQVRVLDLMHETISNMKCNGKTTLQLFQKGIMISITSLKLLFQSLERLNIKYLLTSRLNQDCLENLFSQIRTRGGLHDHPSPLDALNRLRMLVLGKNPGVLKTQVNFNADDGDEFIVTAVMNSVKLSTSKVDENEVIAGSSETDTASEAPSTPPSNNLKHMAETTKDGLIYVAGWIAFKFHDKYPFLRKEKNTLSFAPGYCLPPWLEHLSYGGLSVPTEDFMKMVFRMERFFFKLWKNDLPRGKNVTKILRRKLLNRMNGMDIPTEVVDKFAKLRFFIRLKYFKMNCKDLAKKRKAKQNLKQISKLRKSMI